MKHSAFILALGLATAVLADSPWRDDLWLGRGSFWTSRVGVTVENATDQAWEGKTVTVPLAQLPFKGARVEELRLVDARGVQLEYGVWSKDGKKRVTEGPVPSEGSFAIPVVCGAKGKATFEIYYGNRAAWGLADFWKEGPDKAVKTTVAVGASETMPAKAVGADAAWPQSQWDYRVPVRLGNFTDEARSGMLASFPLPEALHATHDPEYALVLNGKELRTCTLGDRLLFRISLAPKSVTTCYLYVRRGAKKAAAPRENLRSALGSQIPSDQVLEKSSAVDVKEFAALLEGLGNLVKNNSFEDGETEWQQHREPGVKLEIATGGRFGGKLAKTTIPPGVRANWSGWQQRVAVKPGRSYFYGAFISGDNLAAGATVHAHLHAKNGKLNGMVNAGRGVQGTVPWTPVFGTLSTADGTTSVILHLTMNGSGTVAHDGALLAEYVAAKVGDPEFAPAAKSGAGLQVAQIDPVIKVFRETPVSSKVATAPSPSSLKVSLAKNETEPLQLAVRSAKGGEVSLKVEGIPLACEIGRVDYVPVDWPTSYYSCRTPEWELRFPRNGGASDGWSGWWPDPIAPEASGRLEPNTTQAFWVNFTADAATKPGVYTGKVVWSFDGKVVREDPLEVKVWNFAIPARPKFAAVYDLRVGSQWDGLGATGEERREQLWAFMAEKKACPDGVGVDVKFAKDANGNVTADFTEYDRFATRYFDHYQFPSSYTPSCFYLFGWGLPPKKFLDEDPYPGKWPYAGADWTKLRPEYKRVFQQALKLYWDHVKAKGWADKIALYISDEPHFSQQKIVDQMKACCDMFHEVDRSIRIYCSTWRHCPAWNGYIDIWGAGHYGCFPVAELERRKQAGDRIWWTTDGQMCTDTPYCAVERLLPHYAQKYGADVYEFWGSTWLTYDPWKFGWHSYIRQSDTPGQTYWVRYPAGDGYLFYPPKAGGRKPASSIRMEAVRDGVEDFSYLELLAAKAKSDPKAAALLAEFRALVSIPNAGGRHSTRILPEPEKIGRLRERAGELLSK